MVNSVLCCTCSLLQFIKDRMATAGSDRPTSQATHMFRRVLDGFLSNFDVTANRQEYIRAMKSISEKYNELYTGDARPSFDEQANRVAYMYIYFMQECFVTYKALQSNLSAIRDKVNSTNELNICCIGGGPGTDLVALIIFLKDYNILPPSLHCTIFDKYEEWQTTWTKIWETFPHIEGVTVNVPYEKCNVLDPEDEAQLEAAVRKADIVTMIQAFSSMFKFMNTDSDKRLRLQHVFREMKEESVMLYIDSKNNFHPDLAQKFVEWFANENTGLTEINKEELTEISIDIESYGNFPSLKTFYDAFNRIKKPMSKSSVEVRLLQKKIRETDEN